MKWLLSLFLMVTCNTKRLHTNKYSDCGSSYATSELSFKKDTKLKGKLRVIWFSDKPGEMDSLILLSGIALLNIHLRETNIVMEFDSIIEIVSKNKHELHDVIHHAKYYNKPGVFTMYVYGNDQLDIDGNESNIKGSAIGIPSRAFGIQAEFINSSTISHEFFHCIGLYHTHEPDNTDGYNVEYGDKVCDTPSFTSSSDVVDGDCNYMGPQILDTTKIVCNIMSYSYPHCRNCLTDAQIARIRYVIHESDNLKLCFGIKSLSL